MFKKLNAIRLPSVELCFEGTLFPHKRFLIEKKAISLRKGYEIFEHIINLFSIN